MSERIAIETSDTTEFVVMVNRMFGHHRILSLSGPSLRASVFGQRCGELMVGELQYGVDIHADVDEPRQGWVLTHARGADGMFDGQRFVGGDLIMFAPQWCGHLRVARDTQMRNTFVPRFAMDEALHSLLGMQPDRPIEFAPRLDPNTAQAERLRRMIDLMYTADGNSPMFTALLQQAWQRTFAMELLSVWPHSYSRYLERPTLLPRALRRACDFIDAHLGEPVSVVDVARAASVGVRALELGFARHLGASPARYIRARRLDAARQELSTGIGQRRIADVAHKWGFSNPGLFARAYRERFGELPSRRLK